MGKLKVAILTGGVLWSAQARAEDVFPGALQEAAQMECVPSCLMCHTDNPGTATTYNKKPLPNALLATNGIMNFGKKDTAGLKAAYAIYAANPMNADAVALIKQGIEPGAKQDVCTPSYGCGARFTAKGAAPRAALAAALLLGAALLARRYRR